MRTDLHLDPGIMLLAGLGIFMVYEVDKAVRNLPSASDIGNDIGQGAIGVVSGMGTAIINAFSLPSSASAQNSVGSLPRGDVVNSLLSPYNG